MLEQISLMKTADWPDYHAKMAHLQIRMGELQRTCRERGIPVLILFEGYEASGKGTMINKMIQPLDPRGFQVFTMEKESEEEKRHAYLWRYWNKLPAKGQIHIFDRSWYQGVRSGRISTEQVRHLEKQFTEDGMVVLKFFLAITEKEQKKRLKKLEKSKSTKWRVEKKDWEENENYTDVLRQYDSILLQTDTDNAPWTVVETMDKKYGIYKIMNTIVNCLEQAVDAHRQTEDTETEEKQELLNGVLTSVDLNKDLKPEEYREKRKKLQKKLAKLQNQLYQKKIPVILAFEGWDAAGKGGAIKRLTEAMDPRGYQVVPISSPNDVEKAHHYLWRFYEHFPKTGHMAIFDRTWYGRVLVERVEHFATKKEWQRAYNEINEMEAHLVEEGAVVLKFWIHIDKDEQKKRFEARQDTPEKQWKITDEDWRNREKWDEYVKAVDEMIVRTSTTEAPWHIIEGNSKLYARIRILEIVVDALTERVKKSK
ncbi:MAG: phosphate--AMP phosphotransferase [Eubacterium sp.]|nr:phosphate--AMP phosphotransferase [Eubacterium sp.]